MIISNFTNADWIALASATASFLLAFISICVAVVSIRQNNKMLEQSSRAYISIWHEVTNIKGLKYYIVIKNAGLNSAKITSIKCNADLEKYSVLPQLENPFLYMEGSTIIPGQVLKYYFDDQKLFNDGLSSLDFQVEYVSNSKKYSDEFSINLYAEKNSAHSRPHAKDESDQLKIISHALQEIVERLIK